MSVERDHCMHVNTPQEEVLSLLPKCSGPLMFVQEQQRGWLLGDSCRTSSGFLIRLQENDGKFGHMSSKRRCLGSMS